MTSLSSFRKVPVSFWTVGTMGLFWNVFGIIQFLQQSIGTNTAMLMGKGMTLEQAEIYAHLPIWMTLAFSIGVFGGAIGCILLLLRNRHSIEVFIVSLLGYIVLYIGDITEGVFRVFGKEQVMILTVVVTIAIGLLIFSVSSQKKGYLV